MKKNIVKNFIYVLTLLAIILSLLSSNVFAATGTTTLELVEDKACIIDIDGYGKFDKRISNFDSTKKEATLTLTVENTKSVEESQKNVELFLVIDNSSSMIQNNVGEVTRKQVVIDSANKLVDKLFEANSNAKVGIVSFSSLDSVKGETEGTINDAKLWLNLSGSKTDVKSAIASISSSETGPRTNIEAGITLASQNYTAEENTNRFIVLLTDGVPNNALDGSFGTYVGTVGARTKAKLQEIESNGVKVIGAMIGLDGEKVETQSKKTYKALAEEVFGTANNPTISNYYYISDNEIETTIVEKIYEGIVSVVDNSLKDIIIKDYFPQEIIDNFDFAYVTEATKGEISANVDTTDNSITWTIANLKEGEKASVSYKLTLKNNYNKEIVDKVLPTNEKVDLSAVPSTIDTDSDTDSNIDKTSTDSPTVKVLYKEPVVVPDNTVAPEVIPQTGDNSGWILLIIGIVSITYITKLIYLKRN